MQNTSHETTAKLVVDNSSTFSRNRLKYMQRRHLFLFYQHAKVVLAFICEIHRLQ